MLKKELGIEAIEMCVNRGEFHSLRTLVQKLSTPSYAK